MTLRIPRPDPAVLTLARQLADMQRRLREMETASQAGFTSVEGRSLDFYDPVTDEKLGSIGLQPDGTFGFERTGGAKPEAPTEPDVQPIPGGAIVAWDGRSEDAQSMLEIDRIAVHMDETAGFTVSRDTEVAAIYSHTGGTTVIPIDDGTEWYVKLVAVSKGQVWSDPSTEVHVAAVDANVAFYQDEFTLPTDGAQDVVLTYRPIAFSEHLYWNGLYQREDVDWTREELTVSLAATPLAPKAGDVVTIEYAYLEDSSDIVSWQASGWSHLQIATTDTTNRSAAAFDDSTWAVDAAAFGNAVGTPYINSVGQATWPAASTNWDLNTALWIRRTITGITPGAGNVQVEARVDNIIALYWNGTLITSAGTQTTGDLNIGPVTIPANLVTGNDVLAVRAEDDTDDTGNRCYIDVRVSYA